MVDTALEVARQLEQRDVHIGVVDARFVKPLDEELLAAHVGAHRHIVTLEDSQRAGGFGSAVLEAAARAPRGAQIRVLGIPDRYVEHMSSREAQLASVGLDAAGVLRVVTQLLGGVRVS